MSEQKYYSLIEDRIMEHFGFTLIGATTHEGKMFRAFLERFKLTIMMEPYTPEDISKIIIHYCEKLGYIIKEDALNILIDRSRDNPRTITQNIDMLLMLKDNSTITKQDALKATELRGIGPYGLTERDVKILKTLKQYGQVGADTLSEIVDAVDVKNYKIYERYLITKGFIIPTKNGRTLTSNGEKILKDL